jgi:ribosomal protein S26
MRNKKFVECSKCGKYIPIDELANHSKWHSEQESSIDENNTKNLKIVKILEKSRLRRIRIKIEVMTHYGNGKCACVKCGFSDIIALTVDHVNGNGSNHRKENKYVRGNHIYEWLKKNKFPLNYQTLCMNCQLIKRQENHEYTNKHIKEKPK